MQTVLNLAPTRNSLKENILPILDSRHTWATIARLLALNNTNEVGTTPYLSSVRRAAVSPSEQIPYRQGALDEVDPMARTPIEVAAVTVQLERPSLTPDQGAMVLLDGNGAEIGSNWLMLFTG